MKSLDLTKPHLIIMVGIPGAGKSFFAEQFAETFKAPIVNFEKIRRDLFTEPTFNNDEDLMVEKITTNLLNQIVKTDRTIVYVGQTDLRAERMDLARKVRSLGYEPMFVWVQTEPITAQRRAQKTSGLTKELFEAKIKKFSPPHPNEKVIVISGKHTFASQIKIVLKRLVEPRQKTNQPTPAQQKPITARLPVRNRNILIR